MPYEVPLEWGKIREFARAAKSREPAYNEADASVPPTFLTTAQNFWAPPGGGGFRELGSDHARVLHGEEEFEFFGPPPRAGTSLWAESRLDERWEKEGRRGGTMRFARIVTEFRDADGTLVAEQRTTAVETARPPKEG